MTAPLEDPDYEPVYPPLGGRIPDVVARWGKKSQLRWFERFAMKLNPLMDAEWAKYWVSSEVHMGLCCASCEYESYDGYGVIMDGYCCCRGIDGTSAFV